MAWSTPLTAVASTALTAAQWNASVRDNLNQTAAAKATTAGSIFAATGTNTLAQRIPTVDYVSTTVAGSATSYANLTGSPGPAVTVTSGVKSLVVLGVNVLNDTVNAESYYAVDISGATTEAANDNACIIHTSATANAQVACGWAYIFPMTSGSSTYTAKYRVGSASNGSWGDRRISVIPF